MIDMNVWHDVHLELLENRRCYPPLRHPKCGVIIKKNIGTNGSAHRRAAARRARSCH